MKLKITLHILVIILLIGMVIFTSQSFGKSVPTSQKINHIEQQLNNLLHEETSLNGALVGISVRSASTGELLFDHMGDVRLKPASNLKLLTATAALSILGEDFTFETNIVTDGILEEGTVKGNLYLSGKGDPTLLPTDLEKLANQLQDVGINKIEGNIYADDSWYDSVRYSSDMIWSDEHTYYGAQTSALTVSPNKDYDAGTVIVDVRPNQEVGNKAVITMTPQNNYVTIDNRAVTVAEDKIKDISIKREHGTNKIIVEGTVPIGSTNTREWIAIWDPTKYALSLFKQALKKNGIEWAGKSEMVYLNGKTKQLVSHTSIPLSELLIPFMKLSNNGHAETLIKEMGKQVKREGSWEQGIEVVKEQLASFGVNPEPLVIRDGSGISHINLVPANVISELLYQVQDESWFPTFLQSLPAAGAEERMVGGTLRYRLKDLSSDVSVYAKTGTLSTVSSLAGYIETRSGERLIFSILLNSLINDNEGKRIEDEIVSILAKTIETYK